jgi:hypothetical protein
MGLGWLPRVRRRVAIRKNAFQSYDGVSVPFVGGWNNVNSENAFVPYQIIRVQVTWARP